MLIALDTGRNRLSLGPCSELCLSMKLKMDKIHSYSMTTGILKDLYCLHIAPRLSMVLVYLKMQKYLLLLMNLNGIGHMQGHMTF